MNYQDLFAGKTKFTISNEKDQHYTFKVKQIKDTHRYMVLLLTGPNNSNDFTYLGMLWDESVRPVSLTQKSKFNKDSTPYKVFCYAQSVLANKNTLPEGYSILPSGTCFKCGRELTTPESIRTGYGPVCGGRNIKWEK